MQDMENNKSRESKHSVGTYILYATDHAKDRIPFSVALQEYSKSSFVRLFTDNEIVKPKISVEEGADYQFCLEQYAKELKGCVDLYAKHMPFNEEKIKSLLQTVGEKLEEIIQPIRSAFENEIKEEKGALLAKEQKKEKEQEKIVLSAEELATINMVLNKYAIRIFISAEGLLKRKMATGIISSFA